LIAATLAITAFGALADDAALIAETKKTALAIPPKLLQMVQEEIDKGSYHGAIAACNDKAPKMAAAASQNTGWAIRRVSLKNRNPKAVPDAWERGVLEDFRPPPRRRRKRRQHGEGRDRRRGRQARAALHEGAADPGPVPQLPRHR
jgi:hypothetical protein